MWLPPSAPAMDYKNPLRKGNTGTYQYFKDLLLGRKLMNEPLNQ